MNLFIRLILAWAGFLLLWLVFVFQVTTSELIVGAFASGFTVGLGYVTFRIVPACFDPQLHWMAQAWRLPVLVATDLWLLLKHLGRQMTRQHSRSSFEVTRFEASGDDCHAAAQRALAILFVSTTPNSVVLDIDRDKGELLFHQLEPAPVPELLRNLED